MADAGEQVSKLAPPSVYIRSCVEQIAKDVYGRDNRRSIHDVLEFFAKQAVILNIWANDIGLTVMNRKLCAVYNDDGSEDPDDDLPTEIKTALKGILTDIYGSEVRQDIASVFEWSIETSVNAVNIERSLGLTVENGMLCAVYNNDGGIDPDIDDPIPADIQARLGRILTEDYGRELRDDIVIVLRWGLSCEFSEATGEASDLGLTVIDGKLCMEYYNE